MKYRKLSITLAILLLVTIVAACAPAEQEVAAPAEVADQPQEMRTYYMVSSHQAHPYFADSHLALRYAAEDG